ncbi:hypothetical protein R1flu_011086 [Riccia fluitans]|uniref:Uncharacterized protein n=1 Tax=Riccia fluitans TaxID=41844 RepID=A0ABD1Z6U6_9MARC
MKIKKDGHLVEPLGPDVDAKSQKTPKKKQTGSEQPSRKRPRFESDPKDGNEGNLPSAVETSRKEKGKVTNPHIVRTWIQTWIYRRGKKNVEDWNDGQSS